MIMLKTGLFLLGVFITPCIARLSRSNGQHSLELLSKVSESSNRAQLNTETDLYSKVQGFWNSSWPTIVKLKHESVVNYGFPESVGDQPYNLSEPCIDGLLRLVHGVSEMDGWALEMLDASGKLPSGLLLGNTNWIGMYSECIGVSSRESETQQLHNDTILGQYCIVSIGFDAVPSMLEIELGVCIPHTCDSSDAVTLVNLVLSNLTDEIHATVADCRDDSAAPLDSGAIVVITILCVLGLLLILGTCLDVTGNQFLTALSVPAENGHTKNVHAEDARAEYGHKENGYAENGHVENAKNDDCDDTPLTNGNAPMEQKNFIVRSLNTKDGIYRFLMAFSVLTNAKKILSLELPQQNNRALDSLNGIRFFSMSWVILTHTYLLAIPQSSNIVEYPNLFKRFSFQPLINGAVAVETFFLISGTLASYLLLLELRARNGIGSVSWPRFYFHRFWRLTPLYMMVLAIYTTLFKYFGNGPFWSRESDESCKTNWWANMLYINNIVDLDSMCMTWSWYLSNDMQFYLLLPIFVALLYKRTLLGGIVTFVVMLISATTTGVITYVHNFPPASPGALQNMSVTNQYMKEIYFVPWCRIGPYLIGILLGYLLYRTNCKLRMRRSLVVLGWCLAAACNLSVVYGLYNVSNGHYLSRSLNALYASLHRIAWTIGVSWVIFACATENGGVVNGLLSMKVMIPLSRLSYAAYLVHQMVILWYYQNLKVPVFLDDIAMVYLFLGHLVLSYICAFVFSIAFESPMINLERSFLRKRRS